jgi:hypothetical protein
VPVLLADSPSANIGGGNWFNLTTEHLRPSPMFSLKVTLRWWQTEAKRPPCGGGLRRSSKTRSVSPKELHCRNASPKLDVRLYIECMYV